MNTASQCGYTPQYEGLEALSNREIAAFCVNQYAIDFPMFAKIPVKGKEAHPFYAELAKATWDGAALEFP